MRIAIKKLHLVRTNHPSTGRENPPDCSSGAQIAVKCANLIPHGFGDDLILGGVVRSMAWDPLGERLAIIFEGKITTD